MEDGSGLPPPLPIICSHENCESRKIVGKTGDALVNSPRVGERARDFVGQSESRAAPPGDDWGDTCNCDIADFFMELVTLNAASVSPAIKGYGDPKESNASAREEASRNTDAGVSRCDETQVTTETDYQKPNIPEQSYRSSIFLDTNRSMQDRVRDLTDPLYWRKLCPELHISDAKLFQTTGQKVFKFEDLPDRVDELRDAMHRDGYYLIHAGDELPWAVDLPAMARAVRILGEAGWPPSFLLVYDEPWAMAHQLRQLLMLTTGNQQVMDWFFFHVDPSISCSGALKAGWAPHRDRGQDEAAQQFRVDGTPRYNTTWIPLTNATPSNSCLMCVPKPYDEGYLQGDRGSNPLSEIFKSPESFQAIRALPCNAGSVVSFTHRMLHWGAAADPHSQDGPRIALSFAAASDDFEKPYLDRSHLPCPSVELRVALVAAQSISYCQNEMLDSCTANVYRHVFLRFGQDFEPAFSRRVHDHMSWLEQYHHAKLQMQKSYETYERLRSE